MNVLAYSTQDPHDIGGRLQQKLSEELGLPEPIPFLVEEGSGAGGSVGVVLGNMASLLVGGAGDTMYVLNFAMRTPRASALRAHVNRQGIGCHIGQILFTAALRTMVGGEVTLDERGSSFIGDPGTASRLNAARGLAAQVAKLARTSANLGGIDITAPRIVRIAPTAWGSTLTIGTLGRGHAMGFKTAIDVREMFEVADAIEAHL